MPATWLKTNGKPKRPRWRKPKLSQAWIDQAKKVLDVDHQFLAWTEKEIFDEINYRLDKEQQISYTAYKDYKAGNTPENPEYKQLFEEFAALAHTAERRSKWNLIKKLADGDSNWKSRAWIVERRFRKSRGEKKEVDVNLNNSVVYLPMVEWEIIEPDKKSLEDKSDNDK